MCGEMVPSSLLQPGMEEARERLSRACASSGLRVFCLALWLLFWSPLLA